MGMIVATLTAPWVRCPRCQKPLEDRGPEWSCTACGGHYPVIAGIPDLRVEPDPWISLEDDRRKGRRILDEAPPGFPAAVSYYWTLTPDTPAWLARRHMAHVLHGVPRMTEWLAPLRTQTTGRERWLDVGAGTAALAAAAGAEAEVVSVDVAFRWLCVAQRRFVGAPPALMAANGEALPIADGSFDRVFLLGVLEHTPHGPTVLAEAFRVLRPGGVVHVRTVNRFSLLPEPHVSLWGIGYLPRRFAHRYAQWRGRGGYQHHFPGSARQLARRLKSAGFRATEIHAAPPLEAEAERLPAVLRPAIGIYRYVHRWPGIRTIAPLLEARGRRP